MTTRKKAPKWGPWKECARRRRAIVVSRGHFCILWEVDEQRRKGKKIALRTTTALGVSLYRNDPRNAHLIPLFDVAATATRALETEVMVLEDAKLKMRTNR